MPLNRLTFVFALLLASASLLSADSPRSRENFDLGWSFVKGDPDGAAKPDFDASDWRELDLPHDWSVEGPFDPDAAAGAPGGYLPAGIGWYRKAFKVPESLEGRRIFIEFDGIYMNGEVWINGKRLGKRPYGYIGVEYELTPHLNYGGRNVVAVRVDDSRQPSARWYGGAGIYRHVWLTHTDPIHVDHWGTYIRTPEIRDDYASVLIDTTVTNDLPGDQKVTVLQEILTAQDEVVARTETTLAVPGSGEAVAQQDLTLPDPIF